MNIYNITDDPQADSAESRLRLRLKPSSATHVDLPLPVIEEKMRLEWDERARRMRVIMCHRQTEWSDEEYFESGRENVRRKF